MSLQGGNVFLLMVNGQIENLEFPQYDDIYCRFQYVFGQDWDIASGIEEGLTQTVKKSLDENQIFTLNFPIDVGFKSTNPFGWPRLIIQAYGYDLFGKDVIRGYGMVHIPVTPGRHEKTISLFVPEPSSQIQQFIGWLTSRQPELINPRAVAEGDGREVTKMRSQGKAKIVFNIVTKDLKQMGYNTCSSELLLRVSKMSIEIYFSKLSWSENILHENKLKEMTQLHTSPQIKTLNKMNCLTSDEYILKKLQQNKF